MKVADYVINYLAEQGIDKIFVVYGAANGDLIDAFTRVEGTDYVCVMHEQSGGFAAEGYAKISNNFGVAISTSGPGGQNFVTPIANCYYDSVPCLFITGQVKTQFMRKNDEVRQVGFQETPIVDIVKPITKYASMVMKPEDIRWQLEKALWLMKKERPGPVLLDLPIDIQKAEIDPDELMYYFHDSHSSSCATWLDGLCLDLLGSKRPVIIVGNGVRLSGAVNDLLELGKQLKIPMFPTWNAIDVVPSDYPYYGGRIGTYGGPGRNFGVQNADFILCIGSRLSGRITGGNVGSFGRGAIRYVVDVDEGLLKTENQELPFHVSLGCDAKVFIKRLHEEYLEPNPDWESWMSTVRIWKDKYDPVKPEYFEGEAVHPYAFMRELSNQCGPNDIIVGDCGGNIVILNHAFKTKQGQRVITNNGNSPMGFSMAGAMGAWFAKEQILKNTLIIKARQFGIRHLTEKMMPNVICIIGDGGMNMNIQELQTIINYNINIKIFIINNNIYGITKAFQEVNFEGRCEACGPKGYNPPDFSLIADAYGIPEFRLANNQELKRGIKTALDYHDSIICNVMCPEYHTYEPKIVGWNTPIEDMYPYLDRNEFKLNMAVEPLKGWETHEY